MGREIQQKKCETTKQAIIDTTLEIVKEKGFNEVSIRKIATKMGYSTGVIYYHFKDKLDIIDTIHKQANIEIEKIVKTSYKEELGCLDNIKNIFHNIMLLAVNEKDMFDLIVMDKYSVRKESISKWVLYIEEELNKAIKKGEIKNINTHETSFCIWSSYLGFHYMLGKDKNINLKEAEKLFNTMSILLLEGLKKEKGLSE